ncbi:MAG: N-methyl-D-aspartate receptor NMDAR2C subunit [bacterium]
MPDFERWQASWKRLGVNAPEEHTYAIVIARYAEPQRKYHTMQHLDECFAHFDAARHLAERPDEVEVALWFHDAVYDVRADDNEERSAEWAGHVATQLVRSSVAERISQLVLATKHNAAPPSPDAALLVDVDLAILGAVIARFDEYEQQVREEYAWVPGILFRRERRKILQGFLARPHVYSTEHFRTRYEQPARANLTRSIERLGG